MARFRSVAIEQRRRRGVTAHMIVESQNVPAGALDRVLLQEECVVHGFEDIAVRKLPGADLLQHARATCLVVLPTGLEFLGIERAFFFRVVLDAWYGICGEERVQSG